VRCERLDEDLRNLLSGRLAQGWTEESRDDLETEVDALTQWACRDGGELAPDFAARLDRSSWRQLVRRFLLT
jgi:hypothetical protein